MIIGIAGKSCSGKTSLARRLGYMLGYRVLCLEDTYCKGEESWEDPRGYDFDRLQKDIALHKNGNLIIEGFLLFTSKKVTDLLDIKIFLDVSDRTIISRRLKRGQIHKRDLDLEYLRKVVVKKAQKYEKAQKGMADHIVDSEVDLNSLVKKILKIVEDKVVDRRTR